MSNIDKISKELEAHKNAIVDDRQLEEEEEQRRKKNQELMDRFNAINDSLKFDENLLKPSAFELKFKQDQEAGKSSKLDDLDLEFKQTFAKMGELIFNSGLFNQLQNHYQEDEENQQQKQIEDDESDEKDQIEQQVNKEQQQEK
ncbi:hypothetical protein TTHERM_00476800 (macronuclear) [Tetrahymena thermophila SB210]|uniref:Uncharacterized protein n=1 Tax=Tetrahymena thermophila (strain SB210) TaxID=312017 RepID=I7M1L8_TETTS|nr:hypothetical protein TTHERM_00476800 [Tetrahymena thermophila SB210]EAR97142.2 hypothetical protein TTHERM_00476800 [Tetrahymena thermophila SB210]|eukprot:XP_001017387.2 hypothetical protein TTHERM_00476800 [Tetrahymena thermophila SB210]